jgi:hypothetical protein
MLTEIKQFEIDDPIITSFQTELFREHGLDFLELKHINSHKKWIDRVGENYNDCYRWLPYRIVDFCDTCFVISDNKPVSVSFTKMYSNFLRVGVGFYTLRDYRKSIRNPIWHRENGYFKDILSKYTVDGYFASYHETNPKMIAIVKMLKKSNKSGVLGESNTYLSEFSIRGEPIIFNNVLQSIAYRNNTNTDKYEELERFLKSL